MLAIAGGKGGCGKTTTACGLSLALAARGRCPVVVDGDVDMPDLHERIGAAPDPGLDELAEGEPLEDVLQRDHDLPGVGIVATGEREALGSAVDRLSRLDPPVLVDCPAGAGRDVARSVRAADRTVVVSTDTRASLEDAAKTAAMSRTLGTPVACLVLRETPTRGSPESDDRLRHLVEADRIVRVPTYQGNNVLATIRAAVHLGTGVRASATRPTGGERTGGFGALAGTLYGPASGPDSGWKRRLRRSVGRRDAV